MSSFPAVGFSRLVGLARRGQQMELAVGIATGDNREAYEHWLEEIQEGELSMVKHELDVLLAGHE